jgi:HEAT repeat protein
MNPSLLGALTAFVLTGLWLLGRRRSPLEAAHDTSAVVALNRAQIALVQDLAAAQAAQGEGGHGGTSTEADPQSLSLLPLPASGRERLAFLARLGALARGDAGGRLQAMAAARRWGHPAALPLLRRGLRDPDPAVMREAARAMEQFRGRPFPSAPPLPGVAAQWAPRPRKVARIR